MQTWKKAALEVDNAIPLRGKLALQRDAFSKPCQTDPVEIRRRWDAKFKLEATLRRRAEIAAEIKRKQDVYAAWKKEALARGEKIDDSEDEGASDQSVESEPEPDVPPYETVLSPADREWRNAMSALVDHRSLCRVQITPPAGVCTVFCDSPIPTWQRFSYFEIYVVSARANTEIVVGLVTRPYPQWCFPGFHHQSVGFSSKGVFYHSKCDYDRPYGLPWGTNADKDGEGKCNNGVWQDTVRQAQEKWVAGYPEVAASYHPDHLAVIQEAQRFDCIGCYYNRKSGRVRFVQNGMMLPPCSNEPRCLYYPAISADGPCDIRVNFGTQPFHCADFNFQAHGFGMTLADPDITDEDLIAQQEALVAEEARVRAAMLAARNAENKEKEEDARDAAAMKLLPRLNSLGKKVKFDPESVITFKGSESNATAGDSRQGSVSRNAPPQEGILTVHLKHAKGLQNADTFGLSDPYVVLDVVYADGRYAY